MQNETEFEYYKKHLIETTSPENWGLVEKFVNDVEGIGSGAIRTKAAYLRSIFDLLKFSECKTKPFHEWNKQDIKKSYSALQVSGRFKPKSLNDLSQRVRKFWKWLFLDQKIERGEDGHPLAVSWLKGIGNGNHKHETKHYDVLSLSDVKRLIKACGTHTEKTIISCLYQSAARPQEFFNLRIRDIKFDEAGAKMFLCGVKGSRWIRLAGNVGADVFLKQYLTNNHPDAKNPNSALWGKTLNGTWLPYRERFIEHLVRRLKKQLKIQTKLNPYTFRHSRLTELASKIPEQQLKAFAGHTPSSPMVAVYMHLSEESTDAAIRQAEGGEKKEFIEEPNPLVPIICPVCRETNPASNDFCYKCESPLNQPALIDLKKNRDNLQEQVNDMVAIAVKNQLSWITKKYAKGSKMFAAATAAPGKP